MKSRLIKSILKKTLATFLTFSLLFTSVAPGLQAPLQPRKADAASACISGGPSAKIVYQPSARVGGVALDQAAKFLANMDDITGAYYDQTKDRIVFVGKQNTSLPEFDKDDLAVAIKAVIFNKTVPMLSIERNSQDPNSSSMEVVYYGGIEDTRFGKVLLDADYKMKKYEFGYDENQQPVTSSVPGYKSFMNRYIEKTNADPVTYPQNSARFWLTPKLITLKKDDNANAFVFDQAVMEIRTEALSQNDPAFDAAANEFAQHHTDNYDLFAQETPAYADAKQLGKIVSVIKWLNDNNIDSDFGWARDYAPKFVSTPRYVQRIDSPEVQAPWGTLTMSGGADYATPNTYNNDNGSSASLKSASEAVNAPKEDIEWTFVKDGQQYQSVAVAADAFRSIGSYDTSSADMSFPTSGDLNLAFTRTYSSYSGGQYGIGRGWNIIPAKLYDNKPHSPEITATCNSSGVTHLWKLAADTPEGGHETFTFASCAGYSADDPAYHSKLTAADNNSQFIVTSKNQNQYIFDTDHKLVQIKDKNGNAISYNYNTSGKLINIVDEKGNQINVNYSNFYGQSLISSISDWSGRTVQYNYDSQGNLLTVTDPRGYVTTYTYDSNYKLTSITDREGTKIVENTYTPEAKVATQKDASNTTTTHVYDEANKKVTVTDNLNRSQVVTYDAKARILERKDPAQNSTVYTYGTELSPLTVKDKNNNVSSFTYDANGNITVATYPNNKTVQYEYDTKNRLTKVTDNRYDGIPKITTLTYDASGNLTSMLEDDVNESNFTYNGDGELLTYVDPMTHTTSWTRDNFGNKLTETRFYQDHITTYTYNSLGRLTKETDAEGREQTFTYDANGNIQTKTDGAGVTNFEYDKENRLKKTTLPNNAVTNFAYNPSGSLTSVTDALNNATNYAYDVYQNLSSKQDALNRQTEYIYDNLNRRTQSTTPLGKVAKWEYDANGNMTKRIDENNAATLYQYDEMNRLEKITYPNLDDVLFTYDDRGNMIEMEDSTGTTSYGYDRFDRLVEVENAKGTITYEYDLNGQLHEITYPDGKKVSYNYDSDNTLARITDWNNKNIDIARYDNGLPEIKELPNGLVAMYTYDNANRLASLEYINEAEEETVAKFTYERDSVGNITKASESGTFFTEPASSPTPTPTSTPSQNDHVIYGDALGAGWENWSWGSSFNFSDTSYVHSGNNNMSWTVNSGYAGMYLHKNGNIDTEGYTHFTFALKASQTGQNVQAQLWDENGSTIGSPVSLSNYGGQPVSGSYTVYSIPLADLGGTDRLISGILLQDISGSAKPAMYVDSMSLKAAQNNQPTATPTPSTTPPSTAYAYDDALTSGWENWSWGSAVDTNNTTNVHEGTKSLSWTVNSGYAGLYLHKSGNLNTTGYTDFTFALKATQANQNVQVQLWDENGSVIGSPLNLNSYGGQPTSSAYKVYTIPLQDLGGTDRQISGLLIQDISGAAQPAMYVDAVGFVAEDVTPTPTQAPQTETSLTVYDEGLESSWQNWSWGSTLNFDDTAMPNTGTKNISWEVTSGHGAIYLFNEGVSTNGYDSLKVSMRATQAGASIGIGLKDQNNNDLGTGILLSNYGGNPEVGAYKHYTIPLADLNGTDKIIKGIVIQDKSGSTQPTVYLDTLKFVGTSSSEASGESEITYTYDLLGRLLSGNYPTNDYSYTYDKVGNMLTNVKNGQSASMTYNNDDQLTAKGNVTYTYDNRGNRITAGSKGYSYNFDNKLTQFIDASVTTDYKYDGKGNRLEKKVGNVTIEYINDVSGDLTKILVAKNNSNNTSNYFVQGPEVVSEGGASTNDRKYYIHDGLGNIRFITGADGGKVQELSYDPYGNPQENNGSSQSQFKGEQPDQNGMYFMRARYYDPATGSFISRDPIEGAMNIPQSQNPYAYALNNPVIHSDPSGEIAPIIALALISGGAGALSGVVTTGIANPNATAMDYVAAGAVGGLIGGVSGAAGVAAGTGGSAVLGVAGASTGVRAVTSTIIGNASEGIVANGLTNLANGDDATTNMGQAAVMGAVVGIAASEAIPLRGYEPQPKSYYSNNTNGTNMHRVYRQQAISEVGMSSYNNSSGCR